MKWIGIKNLEAEFLYKNKLMSLKRGGCNINDERFTNLSTDPSSH